jgi:transcriptional regulator with XRE-family HTH domain
MQRFGAKLRLLRQRHGMSVRDLAEAIDYRGHSRISEIETGKRKPTAEFVFKVARLLGVTMEELMDDTIDIPPASPPDESDVDE